MLKISHFLGESEAGPLVVPLFGPADSVFEKVASATLLPEVVRYIEALRPSQMSQYVLVNAMGAGEYWGSNVNGDHFPETALIHKPDNWTGNPLIDRISSRDWAYGFPTFYGAHAFAHHKNKDPSRAYGSVELSIWNPKMKRVELVIRVDKDRCEQFGGTGVWDKLKAGQFVDVSMGCFKAGAMVTLADGTRKPIEEILVGDRVRTHTGNVGKVTELHRRRYRGELFEIRPANEDSFTTTVEHPFFAARDAKNSHRVWLGKKPLFDWTYARDLEDSVLARPKVMKTLIDESITPEWARIIGYYLAEGHIVFNKVKEPSGIELTVNNDDPINEEITDLCLAVGTRNAPVWRQRENSDHASAIGIYDPKVAEMCTRLAGRYSKSKKLAEEVLYWPEKLQCELLGAYFNGDGFTANGDLLCSTASEDLAHQVREILYRLGVPTSYQCLRHRAGSGMSREDTFEWVVSIGKQWAGRFSTYCAKAHATEVCRAKNVYKDYGDLWAVPIREYMSYYGEADVYNFEVEGDNSYIVNGVAVHNCKVPFDTCSICLDWDAYNKALATFKPGEQKHPGEAVLIVHKRLKASNGVGIRGVSITRADYCEHAKKLMNRILPDGRKVFVYNDFPRFFDISFVFIGADKTAKVMLFIYRNGAVVSVKPSAEVAEDMGYRDVPDFPTSWPKEKAASVEEEMLKVAFFGKAAKNKRSEITKDVIPSQFVGKAVPVLSQQEEDLPRDALNALSSLPLNKSLSTAAGLGMVLRPREFQRVVLMQLGKGQLADDCEAEGRVFPKTDEDESVGLSADHFLPALARLLLPLLALRSALGPVIEKRAILSLSSDIGNQKVASSHSSELFRKIGAAYNGYRRELIDLVAGSQSMIASAALPMDIELHKIANAPIEDIFTPMSVAYLKEAFLDEVPIGDMAQGVVKLSVSGRKPACRGVSPQ